MSGSLDDHSVLVIKPGDYDFVVCGDIEEGKSRVHQMAPNLTFRQLADTLRRLADFYAHHPECGVHSCVGSRCIRAPRHDGEHRSEYGSTWTDESNRRYGDSIAKTMKGRRD